MKIMAILQLRLAILRKSLNQKYFCPLSTDSFLRPAVKSGVNTMAKTPLIIRGVFLFYIVEKG